MRTFPSIDELDVAGKTVLVRMDLNVPMQGGRVLDNTRIVRQLPTLTDLAVKKAKVVILSHLGRPEGTFVPSMSLAPLVDALAGAMGGREIKFGVDCVGTAAREAVAALRPGEILLLENLRFHPGEKSNDKAFAKELAALGDAYVNEAFSCSHRAHASIVHLAEMLPAAAGRLMHEELETLDALFNAPERPIAAVVGGAKVSTKLALLEHLVDKMDHLLIGGAMANTFLAAQGHDVGASLCEPSLKSTARRILEKGKGSGCSIWLPRDLVVTQELATQSPCAVVNADGIGKRDIAADIGPETVEAFAGCLAQCKTVVWNGPLGAFETSPFDVGTLSLARTAARLTRQKKLKSVAGGGDTVAAITHAGLGREFSYLSTAGGAFLEWLEGKLLPGVAALVKEAA